MTQVMKKASEVVKMYTCVAASVFSMKLIGYDKRANTCTPFSTKINKFKKKTKYSGDS